MKLFINVYVEVKESYKCTPDYEQIKDESLKNVLRYRNNALWYIDVCSSLNEMISLIIYLFKIYAIISTSEC